MEQYKDIQIIPLKEIASNTFHKENYLGGGGFGNVYKGQLSRFKERGMVAFKKLNRIYGQGETEFFKEISMLSKYKHENLITLLGYCMEGEELILVYEHALNGSLDSHLGSPDLTWTRRLKICLQAAKGLRYLHDPNGSHHRVIHRDIKSANILLDDKWNAKVADFGLSKISPENTNLVTIVTGTPGYTDPQYYKTNMITEKSDVYSFGVTLFEVLCGRLCYEIIGDNELNVYVQKWIKSYNDNKLQDIIFTYLKKDQMDQSTVKVFSDIAYKCLNDSREERPSMAGVVAELEVALQAQERYDLILKIQLPKKYAGIVRAAVSHPIYSSIEQLKDLLSEGILLNGGKAWVSINEKEEHIERIHIQACQITTITTDRVRDEVVIIGGKLSDSPAIVSSRFPGGRCYEYCYPFKARVRGQYLTPDISYTLNLVFRYKNQWKVEHYNLLRYTIEGEDETKVFIIYPTIHEKEDGWFVAPLYQFTSQNTTADLQFDFEDPATDLLVAGIEFQPCGVKVELQVFEEYQDIIKDASQSLTYRSLEELKQILSKGVYLHGYKTWFSLNEKGEHCHMISMEDCLIPNEDFPSLYESDYRSRFPAGFYDTEQKGFRTHVKTELLNPFIPYTVNLVFQLVFHHYSDDRQAYIDLKYRINGETRTTVYLAKKRGDGLHMAELYQVTSNGGLVDLEINFDDHGTKLRVEGILFQPLEKVEDQVLEDDNVEDIQPILDFDSDTLWEKKLPNDYEEILKRKKHSVEGKSNKELYSMLCQGFLIDNGQQWFTVDKNGKKWQMLSTRATCVIDGKNSTWESSNESRFGEVLVITAGDKIELVSEIEPPTLSPDTTYACYLVYNLHQDQSSFESPLEVSDKSYSDWYIKYIYSYLVSPPNTPVIGQKLDENSYNPINRHKLGALPRQRSDGWMEVKVWDFKTEKTPETVSMKLKLEHPVKKDLCGLIIQGIEIRPV